MPVLLSSMYWPTSCKTRQKERSLVGTLCQQVTRKAGSCGEAREMSPNQWATFTRREKPNTPTDPRQTACLQAIIFQIQNVSAASDWELSHHFINQQPCYRLCSASRRFDVKQYSTGGVSFPGLSYWKANTRDPLYLLGRWYFQAPYLQLKLSCMTPREVSIFKL